MRVKSRRNARVDADATAVAAEADATVTNPVKAR
jgi:hypothetical protein